MSERARNINYTISSLKLAANGALDSTFTGANSPPGTALLSVPGNISDSALAVGIDSQGRIVAGDVLSQQVLESLRLHAFFQPEPSDGSFNSLVTPGIVLTPFGQNSASISSLAFDSLNNIVVTGASNPSTNDVFTTARYTDGLLDQTFGIGGIVQTNIPLSVQSFANSGSSGTGIVVGPDDSLYVSGSSLMEYKPTLRR